MMGRMTVFRVAAILVLVFTLVQTPGCIGDEDVRQKQAEVQSIKADATKAETDWKAEAEKARLEAAQAEARADKAAADAANARATEADLKAAAFHAKIVDADTALATLDAALKDKSDPTGGFLNVIVPFVPEPYKGPAAALGTIAALIWRSRRLKAALASIPASLVQPNGDGKPIIPPEKFTEYKAAIDRVQTPTAKAAVDAVTGSNTFGAWLHRNIPF